MGVRKPFDKDLYEKYDEAAKEAAKDALRKKGYAVFDNPDKYAQDLIAERDGNQFLVETEVKILKNWDGMNFPYDTVQLPERKKKFFKKRTLFFIWNKELSHAVTFWSDDVKDLEPVEVPNKYRYKGEMFFQIPIGKGHPATIIKR